MQFQKHLDFDGLHAYLAPSKPHWAGYDDDKFDRVYMNHLADRKGDRLHALAATMISERVNAERTNQTFNLYVNDCIGFRMTPEVTLFFSEFAFGKTDALSIQKNKLRISDLKTGVTPAHFEQLQIYAALFCLEYQYKPFELEIELRIYQNDACNLMVADAVGIDLLMHRIEYLDKRIRYLREEAAL